MALSLLDRVRQVAGREMVAVALVVGVGAYFRLADLGLSAFRGDEGFFWRICRQPIGAAGIFSQWMQLQGVSGQFPFAAAFTKWFVGLLHLPVNHFTVRLPSALWGIGTILAAYGLGQGFGGRRVGLALAALLALNPFHIQLSREAYYYAPMVCGAGLGCWTAFWVLDHEHRAKPVTPGLYVLNAAGFFLLTYSQPSGWPLALCVVLTVLYGAARQLVRTKKLGLPYPVLLGTFLVVGIPLLVVDWGLSQHLHASTSAERRAQILQIFGEHPFLPALWKIAAVSGWGQTPLRGVFTAGLLLLGLGALLREVKRDRRCVAILLYLLAGAAFAMISLRAQGGFLGLRYLAALLPLYLLTVVVGIWAAPQGVLPAKMGLARWRNFLPGALMSVALLLWLWPAYLCTQLTGKPIPYKLINEWVDSNLPPGTLVLVDRWFEPWCELRDEPSTNVFYTYTIPNEPITVFTNYQWRETARAFFARHPDAAYLEIAKSYWDHPAVGPWDWPRRHFARHVAFTNEAGLKLRALGLANREDFYAANTNRTIVELFYHTREDVLAQARERGETALVLYGPGWGHWKNGPGWNQTPQPDYRDWRILPDQARLDLYNLTPRTGTFLLTIQGVVPSESKQIVLAPDRKARFDGGRLQSVQVGPWELAPGLTSITLTDELWSLARIPLLVDQVRLEPVPP